VARASRRAPKAREARHLVAAKERGQRPERSGVAGVVGAELCPHEREQLLGSGPRPGSAPRSSDEGPFHHVRAEHFGHRMIDLGDQKRPPTVSDRRPRKIGNVARRARALLRAVFECRLSGARTRSNVFRREPGLSSCLLRGVSPAEAEPSPCPSSRSRARLEPGLPEFPVGAFVCGRATSAALSSQRRPTRDGTDPPLPSVQPLGSSSIFPVGSTVIAARNLRNLFLEYR
jgi:hypothetical protein